MGILNLHENEFTVESVKNELKDKHIREFAEEYALSYEEAKQGLAEYIYFNLQSLNKLK